MRRALMYASVASMIQQFNMENIRLLLEQGYEVDVACNMEQGSTVTQEKIEAMKQELETMGVNVFHIPVPRNVTAVGGILKSFRASKQLMNERNYSVIHCHSPIGGMVCRLANRFSKGYGKTKMIYTAHGFHFYKGAPKKNWLMYYPVERICGHFTDVLITINREDFALAQKFRLKKNGSVQYVPGIGLNLSAIEAAGEKRKDLCEECGIASDSVLMLSVGELNDNKNHRSVVSVLNQLPHNVHYLICGQGANESQLERLAESLGCGDRLHLLGYRGDVTSVMKSCDLYVFPSKREGLSVALMEAMACGLPCFASDIRGNCDLITNSVNGMLLPLEDFGAALVEQVGKIEDLTKYKDRCREANKEIIRGFSEAVVQQCIGEIYAQ